MQADLGVVLMIFLVTLGFTLYVWLVPYRREKRKTDRYKLFEVRDSLVWLVADGVLNDNDEIFQFLYQAVNRVIPVARPVGLLELVSTLKTAVFIDPQKLQLVKDAVSHNDESVRKVAVSFFSTLADIVITRSFSVRVALAGFRVGFASYTVTHKIGEFLSTVFRTQKEAYELYRDADDMARALQVAA